MDLIRKAPLQSPATPTTPEFEKSSMNAIRDLMQTEQTPAKTAPMPAERVRPKSERLQAIAPQEPIKQRVVRKPSKLSLMMSRLAAYRPAYRPTPKHLVIAGLVLLVLFRPWLVFWTVVFSLFVMIGVFLVLGYDGFWRRAMDLGRWYARRNPERAVELNKKLDAFAMRWDMILDRFPDGTVDGLYMPDFGEMAAAETKHDEALDRRFASLREGEA